jgi:hypothetical protein
MSSSVTCYFNFGIGWWQGASATDLQGMDHVALWVGNDPSFNSGFEGRMIDAAIEVGITPVFYTYVIAEYGKDQMTISDCDEGTLPNLCTEGSNIIRQHWQGIIDRYASYARGLRQYIEYYHEFTDVSSFRTIWLIEPDFYQYSASGSEQDELFDQNGGGIPDAELAQKFHQISDTIRYYLPNAKISIDISPWITHFALWYANFDLTAIDYAHTSGGGTLAGSSFIREAGQATWAEAYAAIGKPIIADAGYGTAGAGTGHALNWDRTANINARILDGVVAVTQMDAAHDYQDRLDTIRPRLTPLPACPAP